MVRKHFFNEDYFEDIDTEEKAYWLGFISADGTVVKSGEYNSYRLRINLQIRDRGHLELLREHLEGDTIEVIDYLSDSRSHNFGTSEQSRVVFNSYKMCRDLMNLNVVPNKTNVLKMPELKKELVRHYIRGFIDGDGCFYYRIGDKNSDSASRRQSRYSFELVGNSEKILNQIIDFFNSYGVKLNTYKRKNSDSIRVMTGSLRNIHKLADIIYKDATIYLERKYEKAETIIEHSLSKYKIA